MTDTNITAATETCNIYLLRGVGRSAHHEHCGRNATHVVLGVNFYCKRHANMKDSLRSRREGSMTEIT